MSRLYDKNNKSNNISDPSEISAVWIRLKGKNFPYPKKKVLLEAVKMLLEAAKLSEALRVLIEDIRIFLEAVSVLVQVVKMLVETVHTVKKGY